MKKNLIAIITVVDAQFIFTSVSDYVSKNACQTSNNNLSQYVYVMFKGANLYRKIYILFNKLAMAR